MRLTNTAVSYGLIHQLFHWATAILIITLFVIAKYMTGLPDHSAEAVVDKAWWFSLHKTIGMALFAVALSRIVWAIIQPHPKPLHKGLEGFAASTVHWVLYGAIVAMPILGWLHHAAAVGYAPIWWPFSQDLPFIPKSTALSAFFGEAHHTMGIVLALSILLHAAGAIKHVVIDKDKTMARMVPGSDLSEDAELSRLVKEKSGMLPVLTALFVGVATAVTSYGLYQLNKASAAKTASSIGEKTKPDPVAGGWVIDHTKSTLSIEITQIGAPVQGRFSNWNAFVTFDPAALAAASIKAEIDLNSLIIGDVSDRAKSPEFLNAPEHPMAVFTSSKVVKTEQGFEAVGELMLNGITQPLTLPFTFRQEQSRAFVTAQVPITRLDFKVGTGFGDSSTVGEVVKVLLILEATKSE